MDTLYYFPSKNIQIILNKIRTLISSITRYYFKILLTIPFWPFIRFLSEDPATAFLNFWICSPTWSLTLGANRHCPCSVIKMFIASQVTSKQTSLPFVTLQLLKNVCTTKSSHSLWYFIGKKVCSLIVQCRNSPTGDSWGICFMLPCTNAVHASVRGKNATWLCHALNTGGFPLLVLWTPRLRLGTQAHCSAGLGRWSPRSGSSLTLWDNTSWHSWYHIKNRVCLQLFCFQCPVLFPAVA